MRLEIKKRFFLSLPFLLGCGFILLKSLSFDTFGFSQSYLTNLWGIIFYFSVFNPFILNIFTVFILGIFADILLQVPFGLSPFLYCISFFVGQFNRKLLLNSSFALQWFIYGIVVTVLFVIGLILLKFLYNSIPHFNNLFFEFISLIMFYPIIAFLCGRLNRRIGRYL